jgi:hypothetical protein
VRAALPYHPTLPIPQAGPSTPSGSRQSPLGKPDIKHFNIEIIDLLSDSDEDPDEDGDQAEGSDGHAAGDTPSKAPSPVISKRPRAGSEDNADITTAVRKMSRTVASHTAMLDAHAATVASQDAAFQGHLSLVALLKDERDKNTKLERENETLRAQVLEAEGKMAAGLSDREELEMMRVERDNARQELAALRETIANISSGFGSG